MSSPSDPAGYIGRDDGDDDADDDDDDDDDEDDDDDDDDGTAPFWSAVFEDGAPVSI